MSTSSSTATAPVNNAKLNYADPVHRSLEHIELVLQETCEEHWSPDGTQVDAFRFEPSVPVRKNTVPSYHGTPASTPTQKAA